MILDNHRITITKVTDEIAISFGLCQAIFMDVFGMKRKAVKIVPKLLTFKQKEIRLDISQEMFQVCSKKIITGDEPWVYDYNIETKVQSSQ